MYVPAASSVMRSVLHRRERLSKSLSVQLVLTCNASTFSRHPFPFPSRTNPTPHEIFHLSRSASQDEIKTRYYELVKVYHPDATHGQHNVSPSVRNARFRAITHAYGVLRGRNAQSFNGDMSAWDRRDEAIRAELRRRARRSRSSSSSTADNIARENTNDAHIWYTLMAFVFVGIVAALSSVSADLDHVERHTQSAAANLAHARAEAQIYGLERRRKIRELVKSFQDAGKVVDGSKHSRTCDTSKVRESELLHGETSVENVSKDGDGQT